MCTISASASSSPLCLMSMICGTVPFSPSCGPEDLTVSDRWCSCIAQGASSSCRILKLEKGERHRIPTVASVWGTDNKEYLSTACTVRRCLVR